MRLHLDCSYTRLQGSSIGITRVVRGLARGLSGLEQRGIELRLAVFHKDGWRRAESAELAPSRASGAPAGGWRKLVRLSADVRARRLVERAIPVPLQVRIWRRFSRLAYSGLADALPPAEIVAGDILVVGDAGWNYDIWPLVAREARKGVRIATILYDLIPLSHPQFCAAAYRRLFEDWLQGALRHSDALLCISEATRSEVAQYCAARRLPCPPTASFRLGGELAPPAADCPPPRDAIRELARRPKVFLTVGTIEPRKNHGFLLDVFEDCWARGLDVTLVIVGRPADGTRETLARIEAHPERARRLFLLGDASDVELDLLYRGARAVILPSLAEGYGLPLVEARQRGCEVLASRLPAFEELADDGVQLFPPGSGNGLRALVEAAAAAPAPSVPSRMPEFTWRDSASQFIAGIERAMPASPFPIPGTSAPRIP